MDFSRWEIGGHRNCVCQVVLVTQDFSRWEIGGQPQLYAPAACLHWRYLADGRSGANRNLSYRSLDVHTILADGRSGANRNLSYRSLDVHTI